MKLKLTKTTVEAIQQPDSGQLLVWDSELTGFGIRLTVNSRTYIAQARVNGKSRRVTLGKHGVITADKARKKAIKALAEMTDGTDPREEKKRQQALSVTLRKVADDYIKDRSKDNKIKPSTIKDINRHVDGNFSTWAKMPISSITRDKVVNMHAEISKRGKAHANQAFRYLRALFNYAIPKYRSDDKPVILENPVDVLSQLRLWNKIEPREIRIPDNKIGTAWNFLNKLRYDPAQTKISRTNADLTTFLLLTGTRWNEAASLTWDKVNLDEGWFYLTDTKNSTSLYLPLSDQLIQILSARRPATPKITPKNSGYVFSASSEDKHAIEVRGTMKKLAKAIGLEKLSPHDLRRTFTNVAWKKCRIPLEAVKLLTNHKLTGDVTIEHYSDKGDLRFLKPETDQVSNWIVEQGRIAAAKNVVSIDDARRA